MSENSIDKILTKEEANTFIGAFDDMSDLYLSLCPELGYETVKLLATMVGRLKDKKEDKHVDYNHKQLRKTEFVLQSKAKEWQKDYLNDFYDCSAVDEILEQAKYCKLGDLSIFLNSDTEPGKAVATFVYEAREIYDVSKAMHRMDLYLACQSTKEYDSEDLARLLEVFIAFLIESDSCNYLEE